LLLVGAGCYALFLADSGGCHPLRRWRGVRGGGRQHGLVRRRRQGVVAVAARALAL